MKNFFLLFLLTFSFYLSAQDQHCATDIVMKRIYEKDPALKLKKQRQDEAQQRNGQRPAAAATYVIPIVFHILHQDGPENISDAQVKDALRVLNRDYARQNPDTTEIIAAFKNLSDSTRIQFALATRDPQGNCTSGIIHHYDADTDWDDTSPTLYSHTWDPTRYLNVYIVRTITLTGGFGASGYTYFPGTFLPGDPYDAIVVLNNYFGTIGTSSHFTSRVLTHEVGHWLNLYHVFGATNGAGVDCSDNDFVSDTPPTVGYLNCPNPAVPSQYQVCNPGVSENFQNYMDYSYCCRMFTSGQCLRMQQALQNPVSGRDNLWTNANLIATGIINPLSGCLPRADFTSNRRIVCAGVPVKYKDISWNGIPTSWSWTFQGGSPATSNSSVPVVTYANPGNYDVILSTSNAGGTGPVMGKMKYIRVIPNTPAYTNFWSEGFENLATLTSEWEIVTSSGSARWEQSGAAFYSGAYSAQLAPANNTRKTVTGMISPPVNLAANPSPVLSFMLATAEVNPNHINSLKVYSSVDCGQTWNMIFHKSGQALVTSSSTAANFIPGRNEWRLETINVPQLAFASYVNFKFEYTRDTIPAANNIFIDNINLTGITSIAETLSELHGVSVYPVPARDRLTVQFYLNTGQEVKFSLYDITGRELYAIAEAPYGAGEQKQEIRTDGLPDGIYFLRTEAGGTTYTRKVVIGK